MAIGWVACASVLGVVAAGCGSQPQAADEAPAPPRVPVVTTLDSAPSTSVVTSTTIPPPSSTPEPPATTAVRPPYPDLERVLSVPAANITDPCPDTTPPARSSGDPALSDASRLGPTLTQAATYSAQHPNESGGYGYLWHSGSDASVIATFTNDIDAHRAALMAIVDLPDELIVCQVATSELVSHAIMQTLSDELEGRYFSIGVGLGPVEVGLAADEEALAAELTTRYANAIAVTVGALAYPLDTATSVCPDPPAAASIDGLRITIDAPAGPIHVPGPVAPELAVRLTNESNAPFSFMSGIATGLILDEAGAVVATFLGAVPAVGIPVDLAPGASTTLTMYVNTASCDPALGYLLPPGDYQLITAVQHSDGETIMLTAEPTPIVVE